MRRSGEWQARFAAAERCMDRDWLDEAELLQRSLLIEFGGTGAPAELAALRHAAVTPELRRWRMRDGGDEREKLEGGDEESEQDDEQQEEEEVLPLYVRYQRSGAGDLEEGSGVPLAKLSFERLVAAPAPAPPAVATPPAPASERITLADLVASAAGGPVVVVAGSYS